MLAARDAMTPSDRDARHVGASGRRRRAVGLARLRPDRWPRGRARRARAGVAIVLLGAVGTIAWMASSGASRVPARTATSTTVTTTTMLALPQPGWTPVTLDDGSVVVDRRSVGLADAAVVTIYRFRAGQVRFALHTGSSDPPGVAGEVGPVAGPKLTAAEARVVVAAFNGGFKVASRGGFELGGRVFIPLRTGLASLVIDANGSAHVGVWGGGLPLPGESVASVRQNLQMLVVDGHLSPKIHDLAAWGSTLGNVPAVARSALGQDPSGSLLYAASMQALPADLGTALLRAGAIRAMQLDINPEWVQLDSTTRPGGILVAGVPNQNRPANQYVVGWTRDFISVTAPGR